MDGDVRLMICADDGDLLNDGLGPLDRSIEITPLGVERRLAGQPEATPCDEHDGQSLRGLLCQLREVCHEGLLSTVMSREGHDPAVGVVGQIAG